MSEAQQPDTSDRGERPGKTRTLWHPLLVRLLGHSLSSAYTVHDEVLVGKMPLRVDILLVRREKGELPESKRREVSALLPLLNRFTLLEFKGPTDSLEARRLRAACRVCLPLAQPAGRADHPRRRFACGPRANDQRTVSRRIEAFRLRGERARSGHL